MSGFWMSQFKGLILGAVMVGGWALFDWALGSHVTQTLSYGQTFAAMQGAAATAFWIDCA